MPTELLRADQGAEPKRGRGDGDRYARAKRQTNFRLGLGRGVATRDQREIIADDYQWRRWESNSRELTQFRLHNLRRTRKDFPQRSDKAYYLFTSVVTRKSFAYSPRKKKEHTLVSGGCVLPLGAATA